MITDALLETIRIIWGGIFTGLFLFYAGGLYYYDEFKLPRFASILVDNLVVCGLTALTYVYLLTGGDPTLRWLVYAICSSFLLRSAYSYLTCPPKCGVHTLACVDGCDKKHCCCDASKVQYNHLYYAMFAANVVAVASGYVIARIPANTWPQWVVFGLSFIPFIFVPMFLHKSTNYTMALASPRSDVRSFMYFAGLIWLAYPTLYALSPVMTGVIGSNAAEFGYALADAITKVLFGLCLSYSVRLQCGECAMCQPGYRKKQDDFYGSGNPGVYAPVGQQQPKAQQPQRAAPASIWSAGVPMQDMTA